MRSIHSLVIMRSLDTRKYADKHVSIKSELLKILSWKAKRKMNWLPTHLEPVSLIHTCMQGELLSARAIKNTSPFTVSFVCFVGLIAIFSDWISTYVSVNSNWVHPLGNSRGLAQKNFPGIGIWLLKVVRGPGFCILIFNFGFHPR